MLLLFGFATLIVGLLVVRVIPPRIHLTLKRLSDRQVLELNQLSQQSLADELEARSLRWAMVGRRWPRW